MHSDMETEEFEQAADYESSDDHGESYYSYTLLNALFSVGTMNADTDSASEESVKVIQGFAHGTLYVRLTCPTMDNRHNKLSQVPEF